MNLITVATFTYPHEAAMLKSRLEAEGIECFLKDENVLSVQPFYSAGVGGVKVQVLESEVMKAKKIADEYYANLQNENTPEIPEEEYMHKDETKGVICPVCGSDDVYIDKTPSRLRIITVLLLGIPLIFPARRKYHCFNCGHNFKP